MRRVHDAPVSPFGWSTARPDSATPRKPLPNRPERVVSCTGTTGRWPAGRGTGPRTAPTHQAPLPDPEARAVPARVTVAAGPITARDTEGDKAERPAILTRRPFRKPSLTREDPSVSSFSRIPGAANPAAPIRRRRVVAPATPGGVA